MYMLPKLEVTISPVVALYSVGAAVLATAGAAYAACYATLLSKPAELLRPRAPKPGKRIFLEYITPVWKRLSFIRKVSARNLFRYKKRFWMTIVGIAGCTALLATGYGLRDSIFDVLTWQFDDLMPYDASISINSDMTPSDRADLMQALRDEPGITAFAGCYERTVDVRTEEGTVGNVILNASADWKYVRDKVKETDASSSPKDDASAAQDYTFDDYINLYPRADGLRRYGKIGDLPKLTPTDEEIVIDEKLSTLLGIKEGDTVTLIGDDEEEYEAVVGGICENYVNHHIYMTSAYSKRCLGRDPPTTCFWSKHRMRQTFRREVNLIPKKSPRECRLSRASSHITGSQRRGTTSTRACRVWILSCGSLFLQRLCWPSWSFLT